MNPAPFLVIPIYVGARFGFGPGLALGFATMFSLIWARLWITNEEFITVWRTHVLTLAAFPLLGAISGELRRIYETRLRRVNEEIRKARAGEGKARRELDLLRASNSKLKEDGVRKGVELETIDKELREILSTGNAGIFANTLEYLRMIAGVEEAALYYLEKEQWIMVASTLRSEGLELATSGEKMAWEVHRKNEIVTWDGLRGKDNNYPLLEDLGPIGHWLAAIPWSVPESDSADAVLMIKAMPPTHVNWENISRISTVCRWMAGMQVVRLPDTFLDSGESLAKRDFIRLLDLAVDTAANQNMTSSLILSSPIAGAQSAEDEFQEVLRVTDVFVRHHFERRVTHAILLPLCDTKHAKKILSGMRHSSGKAIPVDGNTEASDLWSYFAAGGKQSDLTNFGQNNPGLEAA